MTIKDCPDCGGTHCGSNKCPFTHKPDYAGAARRAAELRRDRASERMRNANDELIAAEAEYGAASRDVDAFTNDAEVK